MSPLNFFISTNLSQKMSDSDESIDDIDAFNSDDADDNGQDKGKTGADKKRAPRKTELFCKGSWVHDIPDSKVCRFQIHEVHSVLARDAKNFNAPTSIKDVLAKNPFEDETDEINQEQQENQEQLDNLSSIFTPIYIRIPKNSVLIRNCPFIMWKVMISSNLTVEALKTLAEMGLVESICHTEQGEYQAPIMSKKISFMIKNVLLTLPQTDPPDTMNTEISLTWKAINKNFKDRLRYRTDRCVESNSLSVVRPLDAASIRSYRELGCIENEGLPNSYMLPKSSCMAFVANEDSKYKHMERFLREGLDWMLEETVEAYVDLDEFSTPWKIKKKIAEYLSLNRPSLIDYYERVYSIIDANPQIPENLLDFCKLFVNCCSNSIELAKTKGPSGSKKDAISFSQTLSSFLDMTSPLCWLYSIINNPIESQRLKQNDLMLLMSNYNWKLLQSMNHEQLRVLITVIRYDPTYLLFPLDLILDCPKKGGLLSQCYRPLQAQMIQPLSFKRWQLLNRMMSVEFPTELILRSMKEKLAGIRAAHLRIYNNGLNNLWTTASTVNKLIPPSVENESSLARYSNMLTEMEQYGLMRVDPINTEKVNISAALKFEFMTVLFLLNNTISLHILEDHSLCNQYKNVVNYLKKERDLRDYINARRNESEPSPILYIFHCRAVMMRAIYDENLDPDSAIIMEDFVRLVVQNKNRFSRLSVLVLVNANCWGADVLWLQCFQHMFEVTPVNIVMIGSPWVYRTPMTHGFSTPFRALCLQFLKYSEKWPKTVSIDYMMVPDTVFWRSDKIFRNNEMVNSLDKKDTANIMRGLTDIYRIPEMLMHRGYVVYDKFHKKYVFIDAEEKQRRLEEDEDEDSEDEEMEDNDLNEKKDHWDDAFNSLIGNGNSKKTLKKSSGDIEIEDEDEEDEDEEEEEEEKPKSLDPDKEFYDAYLLKQEEIREYERSMKSSDKSSVEIDDSAKRTMPGPPNKSYQMEIIDSLLENIVIHDEISQVDEVLQNTGALYHKRIERGVNDGLLPVVVMYSSSAHKTVVDHTNSILNEKLKDNWYDEAVGMIRPKQQIFLKDVGDIVVVKNCYNVVPFIGKSGKVELFAKISPNGCHSNSSYSFVETDSVVSSTHMSCCHQPDDDEEFVRLWTMDDATGTMSFHKSNGFFPIKHKIGNGFVVQMNQYTSGCIRNLILICDDKTNWRHLCTAAYYASSSVSIVSLKGFNLLGCLSSEYKGPAPESRIDYFLTRILYYDTIRNIPVYRQYDNFISGNDSDAEKETNTDDDDDDDDIDRNKQEKPKSKKAQLLNKGWDDVEVKPEEEEEEEEEDDEEKEEVDNNFMDFEDQEEEKEPGELDNQWVPGMPYLFSVLPECKFVDMTYLSNVHPVIDDYNMPAELHSMTPEEKQARIAELAPQEIIEDVGDEDGDYEEGDDIYEQDSEEDEYEFCSDVDEESNSSEEDEEEYSDEDSEYDDSDDEDSIKTKESEKKKKDKKKKKKKPVKKKKKKEDSDIEVSDDDDEEEEKPKKKKKKQSSPPTKSRSKNAGQMMSKKTVVKSSQKTTRQIIEGQSSMWD